MIKLQQWEKTNKTPINSDRLCCYSMNSTGKFKKLCGSNLEGGLGLDWRVLTPPPLAHINFSILHSNEFKLLNPFPRH